MYSPPTPFHTHGNHGNITTPSCQLPGFRQPGLAHLHAAEARTETRLATEWLQEELGLGDLVSPGFQHSLGRLPQEPPRPAAWAGGVRWGWVSQQS